MIVPPPMLRPDTLKGIDTLIRADFIAFRETCFNWLLAATGLVVVGLAFEGPELWHEISSITRRWCFRRKFRFSLPEEHTPNWAKLLASLGWLLIVVGVVGEYVADSFVSRADGYVQTFDQILLAETQNRTALASARASAAYERASENEKETAATLKQAQQERADAAKSLAAAETARRAAEGFALQISQANERAANAEQKAAESNETAEREKLARLQLEARLAPRSLSFAQQSDLRERLQKIGAHDLDIFVLGEAAEIRGMAELLKSVIANAGWNVRTWAVTNGGIATGIFVAPLENSGNDNLAGTLASALNAEGLAATPYPAIPKDKWGQQHIGSMLNGPQWDDNKTAPIRMYIGAKL
jgi:hypothetical protein